jgi:hypothetical protein
MGLKAVKGWNLVSITFSGGKSYHGLFHVRGKSDDQIEEMKSLAKSLGACPASLRAHQPVRFPGGTRHDKNGIRKQEIVYLNPKQRCRSFPPAKKGLTTGTTQLDYANQQCQGKFNR